MDEIKNELEKMKEVLMTGIVLHCLDSYQFEKENVWLEFMKIRVEGKIRFELSL